MIVFINNYYIYHFSMEPSSTTKIKVVSVQIFPVHKNVQKSMTKADQLLEELSDKDQIDILVLSEMVFTGYKFKDRADIEPYTEIAGA